MPHATATAYVPVYDLRKILILSGLLLVLTSDLGQLSTGHELWIELSSYRIPAGSLESVALRIGEDFLGEPVVRDRARFESFIALGPDGPIDLVGREGHDPAGFLRPPEEGTWIIGYRSRPSRIEMDAARFEAYLREKGLEAIIDERAARGESLSPGREVYSRCAKAILAVGDGPLRETGRLLGFPLEIVPEFASREAIRSSLRFRILHLGRPLVGALVVAIRRGDPESRMAARSDADGRVRFGMDRSGVWLVDTVHMVEADRDDEADWRSLWASLTMELTTAER